MKCAKCPGSLVPENAGGVEIERCGDCGGIFLDPGELRKITTDGNLQTVKESIPSGSPEDDPRATCPRCGRLMIRTPREPAEMNLDICPKCTGLWLDEGEVGRIDRSMDSIENGINRVFLQIRKMSGENRSGG